MLILEYLWIIPALPLLGAALNGLLGQTWPKRWVDIAGVASTGLSFAAALELFREFSQLPATQIPWTKSYFTWIAAGTFRAGFDLQIDQLTVVMVLVVTGVGWLIHIYSTGYMAREGGYYRFFSYMNLFMFFMLILVMAANFPLLFVGWEGVGLSSYLLIGFYFLRKSAADAGKKAFIVNRIGDFGFMLAMFLIFRTFGSLDFTKVFDQANGMAPDGMGQFGGLTVICLLLFTGAVGKSAQLPLYVWLPDAMEGPTPVSALIHAATMVTAGVYVVARTHVLFRGHLPPDDARIFQGSSVPRRGQRDSCRGRRTGPPQDGRAAETDSVDLLDDADRHAGHRRRTGIFGVFQQGLDLVPRVRKRNGRPVALRAWIVQRAAHSVLHVPADFPRVPRHAAV